MPIFEIEAAGMTFEVEAPNQIRAESAARLMVARQRMTQQATARAESTRTNLSPADVMRERMERLKTVDPERERELNMLVRSKEPAAAGTALALTSAIPLAGGLVTAPVVTAKALAGGLAGSAAGGAAGEWVGEHIPVIGGPTAGKILGAVGGLAGGGVGAAAAPKLGGRQLANLVTGGRLGPILGAERPVAAPLSEAAKQKLANEAERIALRRKAVELSERRLALAEKRASVPTRPVAKPDTTPAAPAPSREATARVLEPAQSAPATNLGGKAKPGPAPTPPEELEATLRKSLEAIQSQKAASQVRRAAAQAAPDPSLQAPRIEVGAQKVGRSVGMTKEEVRQAAGPVLDEARGEASPILPREALNKIIETMKAIPVADREAYVARATSGKTKWQVENIRRTLEYLGLLLPVGVAAAGSKKES